MPNKHMKSYHGNGDMINDPITEPGSQLKCDSASLTHECLQTGEGKHLDFP